MARSDRVRWTLGRLPSGAIVLFPSFPKQSKTSIIEASKVLRRQHTRHYLRCWPCRRFSTPNLPALPGKCQARPLAGGVKCVEQNHYPCSLG